MLTVGTPPPSASAPTASRRTPGRRLVRWTSRPTAPCVPLIRARVAAALTAWGISGDLADTLLLTVAELVGNAVRHAAPLTDRLHVTVAAGGGRLRLEVEDGDPTPPPLDLAATTEVDPDAESGRGLLIVGLLVAEAHGQLTVRAHQFGKTVRVCVPVA
ncbi:ATP-binding protein [Streptomyces vilmorinianum]|uniref:ATP-binding protein n=1 Tax=Streptomyces vilmorinianum TaxID=3051092 RepID=UPI0010FAD5F0|nr:ATP-binding protein [Streptomyces vilmorinianum]